MDILKIINKMTTLFRKDLYPKTHSGVTPFLVNKKHKKEKKRRVKRRSVDLAHHLIFSNKIHLRINLPMTAYPDPNRAVDQIQIQKVMILTHNNLLSFMEV